MRILTCSVAMLTMFGLVPLNAAAQQLEEIIVTAERRTTRLQDTPLAITVFDESVVERARVQTMADLVPPYTGVQYQYELALSHQPGASRWHLFANRPRVGSGGGGFCR